MQYKLLCKGIITMERYNLCKPNERKILDNLYNYLGFSDIISFDRFIDFMFANTKGTIPFVQVLNHTLKHIVTSFWEAYPEYKNNYIKTFWIKLDEFDSYVEVGNPLEYDPKGILRYFVKNNFNKLSCTKR